MSLNEDTKRSLPVWPAFKLCYRYISWICCCYFKLILFFCDLNFIWVFNFARIYFRDYFAIAKNAKLKTRGIKYLDFEAWYPIFWPQASNRTVPCLYSRPRCKQWTWSHRVTTTGSSCSSGVPIFWQICVLHTEVLSYFPFLKLVDQRKIFLLSCAQSCGTDLEIVYVLRRDGRSQNYMTDCHIALEVPMKWGTVVLFRVCWKSCITLLVDGVAIPHKGCPAPNQQVLGKSHW